MTWISGIVMLAARNRSAEILETLREVDAAEYEIIAHLLPLRAFEELRTEGGEVYMVGKDASGEIGIYDRELFLDYILELKVRR